MAHVFHGGRVLYAVLGVTAGVACGDGASDAVRFAEVSAGQYHTCARTDFGVTYCWGGNAFGGLGTGDTLGRLTPVRVASSRAFAAVAAGFQHTCALTTEGVAFCWGGNGNGAVGDGTTTDRWSPTLVRGAVRFLTISAGEGHTCGTAADGTTWCWGAALGPDADGNPQPIATQPTRIAVSFAAVSVGYEIACGLTTSGATYCWGQRPPGVPLPAGLIAIGVPQPVTGAVSLASLSAGHKHACGLTADGALYCWGLNIYGQVGDGTRDTRDAPVPIAPELRFRSVSAHAPQHSCGITMAGELRCWGANGMGRLGDGTDSTRLVPTPVATARTFAGVSVGFYHTCGVTPDGVVLCWGSGAVGQLGTGDTGNQPVPTPVVLPD